MAEPEEQGPPTQAVPPPKGDPAAFALRARPRPVTRLSRRTLVLATAGLTACVFGALWWALGLHGLHLTGGQELYNTDARPASDALNGMPRGYADLTRPKPARPGAPPQLGLPGNPGRPALQPSSPFAAPAPDQAAQERERLRQQAATAGVFFTVSARQAGAGTTAGAGPTAAGATGEATAAPAQGGPPSEREALDPDAAQNGQDRKQAFLNARVDQAIYSPQRLQTPRSPYQLMAGTVMAAALVTGLNSDLPGQVIAQVTEDVCDSVTGRVLLVPQGSRLLGRYDSIVAYGQSRALLAWTRLIMPDGSSIVLDNLTASDTEGYAGLQDGLDYHTWRLLKGIALSTLLGAGSELATNGAVQTSGRGDLIVALRQGADNSANQAGQRIVSKDLAVQPTLTVRPGFPVRVIVNRDVVLRPYRAGQEESHACRS
jgi:type IV secretory pathway VirB10-like protein